MLDFSGCNPSGPDVECGCCWTPVASSTSVQWTYPKMFGAFQMTIQKTWESDQEIRRTNGIEWEKCQNNKHNQDTHAKIQNTHFKTYSPHLITVVTITSQPLFQPSRGRGQLLRMPQRHQQRLAGSWSIAQKQTSSTSKQPGAAATCYIWDAFTSIHKCNN